MTEPVRLYISPEYREPTLTTHIELLFPFWGVVAKESMPYVRAAAYQYQYSTEDFVLMDRIELADYVVMPYNYSRLMAANPAKVQRILRDAREARKPILIDGSGDLEKPINVPDSIILRVSQYRYAVQLNEITIPFPAEDLLEAYYGGEMALRSKSARPKIGFTGWAEISAKARFKIALKELPLTFAEIWAPHRGAEHKGLLFRQRALKALAGHPDVEPLFTARASYSGHVATIQGSVADNRRAFVENLRESQYALCVKGDANSSVRFYEALSMGCIPVFLDTACVLPLEDRLKYREFCVFIDWKDTDQIAEKLIAFHKSCSPERLLQMQIMAREAYQKYLRIDVFSRNLAEELRARLCTRQVPNLA